MKKHFFFFSLLLLAFMLSSKGVNMDYLHRTYKLESISNTNSFKDSIRANEKSTLTINKNGYFVYFVVDTLSGKERKIESRGTWSLKDTESLVEGKELTLNYFKDYPKNLTRCFVISSLDSVSMTLVEACGDSIMDGLPIFSYSFKSEEKTLSDKIDSYVEPIVGYMFKVLFWDPFAAFGLYDTVIKDNNGNVSLSSSADVQKKNVPLVVIWLIIGALFFTFRMGFINIRGIRHAIDLIRGKFDNPDDKGEVSHFQALTAALSATVGLGNIAGVAVAISVGGPGATFWMIIAGLIGMSSKFVECTLGVKYRLIDEKGVVHGGPMYYLKNGLAKYGYGRMGKILAVIFAILCIGGSFGGGNMFQANQAFAQLSGQFSFLQGNGPIFGLVLAMLVGVVIIGGIKSIARVTEKIVPFMASLYVLAALVIIGMNISELGNVIKLIINGAFAPDAAFGGFVGVLIQGFRRATFSNEAGVGSASIAHSAAKTAHPVSEGIVALLEPFIDTVVICSMTALVIIFTGMYQVEGLEGAQLTSRAFGSTISWFPYILVVAIFLFAFSTMISWSYYGLKSWTFLFGKSKISEISYKFIFLLFVVIGSSIKLGAVIDFSDMMILAMAFPNILGMFILSSEVRRDMIAYFEKLKSGEIKMYK